VSGIDKRERRAIPAKDFAERPDDQHMILPLGETGYDDGANHSGAPEPDRKAAAMIGEVPQGQVVAVCQRILLRAGCV
jgi:hypothetical protein